MSMTRIHAGFTLLEMLIVLGIMGILFALGIPMLRPPSAYLFASDLKAMIQQARYEAIKRNTPVAIVWDSANQTYTTRLDATNTAFANTNSACTSGTVINTKQLKDYRNISISTNMLGNGIIWLPTGLARSCSSGAGNSTTSVGDGRQTYNVITSTSGRVRLEKAS